MTTNKLLVTLTIVIIPAWLYACWIMWGWFIQLHCGGAM